MRNRYVLSFAEPIIQKVESRVCMFDLSGIARHLKVSVDQLRIAADLIEQGFSTSFIEKYRGDETSSLPGPILRRLKYEIDRRKRTDAARQRALRQLPKDSVADSELERSLSEAHSAQAVEVAVRCFRARRMLDQSQERNGDAGKLLEAMLTYSGPSVDDVKGWIASQLDNGSQDPELALAQVGRLIATLMSSDTSLNNRLRNYVERNAVLTVVDAPSGSEAALDELDQLSQDSEQDEAGHDEGGHSHEDLAVQDAESIHSHDEPEHSGQELFDAEHAEEVPQQQDSVHSPTLTTQTDDPNSSESIATATPVSPAQVDSESLNTADSIPETDKAARSEDSVAASRAHINLPPKASSGFAKPLAKLTPRQRRRRWLLGVLSSMKSLKKPANKLSAYQQLMLARGVRSHLIITPLSYDVSGLVEMARNAFTDSKHPFAEWFRHAVGQSLEHGLRARIEADALSEMEERACENLLEHATDELRRQLMRRPVRGHTIGLIDTVGPKTVCVVFVNPQGEVLACEELPCSVQPEIVNQSVVRLGEWIHKYRVTLVALTNGPARRFMLATLRELMQQSKDSGLRWTLADRSGAEAYAGGRIGLRELSIYNRRQRAAIWTARCLQDPLVELLKVDINRMRLGSYQRELPQDALRQQIQDTLAACVCARGIDTQNASEFELQFIPGVGAEQAKQIANLARTDCLKSRSQLALDVQEWPESDRRHAIGWLRVFGGESPLDATLIHPEDYRLAQRLVEHPDFSAPPNAPPGWIKRSLDTVSTTESKQPETTLDSSESTQTFADSLENNPDSVEAATSQGLEPSSSSDLQEAKGLEENLQEPVQTWRSRSGETLETKPEPEYPEQCVETSVASLSLDCDKIANQWQVGRAKLRSVANCLIDPFGDPRLSGVPIPMLTEMPTLDNLQPEMCVWAVVVGVADFGAFVELGPNCSGLIHISRLSTQFIEDPHQCVQVGDLLMTWVVSIDSKKNRVALTALSPAQRAQMREEAEARKVREEEDRQQRGRGFRKDQQSDRGGYRGQRQSNTTADSAGSGTSSPAAASGQGRESGGQKSFGTGPGRSANKGSGGQRFGRQGNSAQESGRQGHANQGQGQGRTGSGQGGRPGQGNRMGGGQRGGSAGAGRSHGRDSGPRAAKTIVVQSKKPVAPITQAMKQGDEPLRSFSDLMQFYESQRTVPDSDPSVGQPISVDIHPESTEVQVVSVVSEEVPLQETTTNSSPTPATTHDEEQNVGESGS